MTVDRLGRWRLPAVAALSLLVALAVVAAILLVGRAPTALDGSPPPSASRSAGATPFTEDTPDAAVRAFFNAFAQARETDDPGLIEPFVNGTDSSAYQTAAGFLIGQREVGKASVVTVQELTEFEIESVGDAATVTFTLVEGGYDVDLESGEALESPTVLPARRVRAELVRIDGAWLLDSYGAIER